MPRSTDRESGSASARPACAAAKSLRPKTLHNRGTGEIPSQGAVASSDLFDGYERHVEDQRGVRGNLRRVAVFPVGDLRRNFELTLASDLHSGNTFIPALDDLALA